MAKDVVGDGGRFSLGWSCALSFPGWRATSIRGGTAPTEGEAAADAYDILGLAGIYSGISNLAMLGVVRR